MAHGISPKHTKARASCCIEALRLLAEERKASKKTYAEFWNFGFKVQGLLRNLYRISQ